ncbi:hypothetical protein Micbo1qcDRAFT_203595 [Microdochium bolleyi]|uniref:Uncharacterized protein n=1 Tax=Microdochium bolleyi TaxID=196109 RepID=A0A136J8M1_9PEZI|nr:hypothetical protein Micbo1qcDRAFT_203595 [Microdochium bolleyi]
MAGDDTVPIRPSSPAAPATTEQASSPKEAFPTTIPDAAALDDNSSPPLQATSTSTASSAPAPATDPSSSNTLVWLPPSQYSAIRDKWQDQFIWSPTAFASDLPVGQTSFIGVNRARVDSAVTKPPFSSSSSSSAGAAAAVAGRVVPAATTLGDLAESEVGKGQVVSGGDDGSGAGSGGGGETSRAGEDATAEGQPAEMTQKSTGSTPSKWPEKRPAKTKQWHSFHLPSNSGSRSRRNSSSHKSNGGGGSSSGQKIADVPSIPRQRSGAKAQIGCKGVGRIPVLVPQPKPNEEIGRKAKGTRARHGKRRGKKGKTTEDAESTNNGEDTEAEKPLITEAKKGKQAEAAQAAESVIQEAVQRTRGASNAIIVAEMPEDSDKTPRRPLVLPADQAAQRRPLAGNPDADPQVPGQRSRKTRRSRVRRAAAAHSEKIEAHPQPIAVPTGTDGNGNQGQNNRKPGSGRPAQTATHALPASSNNSIVTSKNEVVPNPPSARADPMTAATRPKPSSSQICVSLNLNLDLEVHLKTKLQGDVTLTLFE